MNYPEQFANTVELKELLSIPSLKLINIMKQLKDNQ